jgi:hypothetical protein
VTVDLEIIASIIVFAWVGLLVVVLAMCKASARADAAQANRVVPVRASVAVSNELLQLYRG